MHGAASAKRQATDQLAGTSPICPVLTYQVEPQISAVSRNGHSTSGRSTACGGGMAHTASPVARSGSRLERQSPLPVPTPPHYATHTHSHPARPPPPTHRQQTTT